MNTELETKKKRIETAVKVAALLGAGFVVAPFIYAAIGGLVGLVLAGCVGLGVVNFAPYAGMKLANWRLKALKAEAAANPIETLENQLAAKTEALAQTRKNLTEFSGGLASLRDAIQDHNRQYPGQPSVFQEKYDKMVRLLTLHKDKYRIAQNKLHEFEQLIEQKRSEWKIAQLAAKAMKLANVGEDFTSKLMADTAVTSVTDSLNVAFAELDVLDAELTSEAGTGALLEKQANLAASGGARVADVETGKSQRGVK